MKINHNKILRNLEKVRIFFKKLLIFFDFIVEELPSIFSILIIPTSLGFLLLLPKVTVYVTLITSILIEIYLNVKSAKKFPQYYNKISWQIALLVTSMFFGILVCLVTYLAKINSEFSLNH